MKQHFILLGKAGLIYYSWLLTILFISLTAFYESVPNFSLFAVVTLTVFAVLLVYSWFNTYLINQTQQWQLRLPYRKQITVTNAETVFEQRYFQIDRLQVSSYQDFYIFYFKRRNS